MRDNPTLFVTGATRNAGYAVARRFAQEGYDVCLTSRSSESAREAAQRLQGEYPAIRALGVGMNPRDPESIARAFQEADVFSGRLDALVCCATANRSGSIMEATVEQFDEMMESNTRGYFLCVQRAAERMIPHGKGAMVLFSSLTSHRAAPSISLYAMSKGGVDVLNRCAAYEFAKHGIRCNLLLAGPIVNDFWINNMTDEAREQRNRSLPAGRVSNPEDVANAVYFLCSEQAATITGTEMIVDSGLNLSLRAYDPQWDGRS